jgi:hypothetical protein
MIMKYDPFTQIHTIFAKCSTAPKIEPLIQTYFSKLNILLNQLNAHHV